MSTARLFLDGREYEIPTVIGSEGDVGLQSSRLWEQARVTCLDPGFVSTSSCQSGITYVDGEKGTLRYRGYPIEQIAQHSSFTEVCYLLIYGELPKAHEMSQFNEKLIRHRLLHEDMKIFFEGFPPTASPMTILTTMVSSLSAYYPGAHRQDRTDLNICRLLAKASSIAAFSYKKSIGQPFIYPRYDLSYTENFLHMFFAVPTESYTVNPTVERALDLLLILHADHEQNASTSTARMVGSTNANLYASIAAAMCALSGGLHGGASQRAIAMLQMIQEDNMNYKKYIARAKDKASGFRLMGFGHRLYRSFDPRERIIKSIADDVLEELGVDDPLLETAKHLEETALQDDFFIERHLFPNIDFYSGIIYRAIGIPTNMFDVMFALGRLPGWIAHWNEMRTDPHARINRPRQIYFGETERDYKKIDKR